MNKFHQEKTILLIKGGISSERDVSLESGKCVEEALLRLGYHVVSFDMADGIFSLNQVIKDVKPLCVFNALHGGWGENGSLPAFFNMLQVPYTHSGVFASATAMNKNASKIIASNLGIDVAKGVLEVEKFILEKETVDVDLVIKPNQEGSSIGVHLLKKGDTIPAAVKQDVLNKKQLIVEEYIAGREFSVAVMNDEALGIIELIPNDGFYDYQHKYQSGMTDHVFPTDLSDDVRKKLLDSALKMHCCLGCKGVSRSDFRYDEKQNRVVFLEINTHPGMTNLSLVPELALKKGISYNQLVENIIKQADFER